MAGKKEMGDHMEEAEQGRATPPTQDGVATKAMAESSARSSPAPSDTNSTWLSVWAEEYVEVPLDIQPHRTVPPLCVEGGVEIFR